MSQRTEGPRLGMFKAKTAIAKFLRVKIDTDTNLVAIAGDEAHIGEADQAALAANEPLTVYDRRAPGTHTYVAGGAIAAGAAFSSAAGGKVVSGTGGAIDIGVALSAASGDNAVFEGLPYAGQ